MISINKEEIQKKYNKIIQETILKNKQIEIDNEIEINRIELKYSKEIELAREEYNKKILEIEILNEDIIKLNESAKSKIDSENLILLVEHEKKVSIINKFNSRLEELNSYKLRIYNSSNLIISFDNPEIIVFNDLDFKEIAQFEISCKEDIQKIKMFLSIDFKLGEILNSKERIFLRKVDFGWEDFKGNYYSNLNTQILDKKLECKIIEPKKIIKFCPKKFTPIKLISNPSYKRPQKEIFKEIYKLKIPIMQKETYIGIPIDFNNFVENKISILSNGSWTNI